MSKPLIDGKKLNESPSFAGLSPSPRATTSTTSSKGSLKPLDNPQSFGCIHFLVFSYEIVE